MFCPANLFNTDCGPPGRGVYLYNPVLDRKHQLVSENYFNNKIQSQNFGVSDVILIIGLVGGYALEVKAIEDGRVIVQEEIGNADKLVFNSECSPVCDKNFNQITGEIQWLHMLI